VCAARYRLTNKRRFERFVYASYRTAWRRGLPLCKCNSGTAQIVIFFWGTHHRAFPKNTLHFSLVDDRGSLRRRTPHTLLPRAFIERHNPATRIATHQTTMRRTNTLRLSRLSNHLLCHCRLLGLLLRCSTLHGLGHLLLFAALIQCRQNRELREPRTWVQ
jgi:hypothetical protein